MPFPGPIPGRENEDDRDFRDPDPVDKTLDPRDFDQRKRIVRPRDRETNRWIERFQLSNRKVETFFGKAVEVTFTDGTNSDYDHDTVDLDVPHSLSVIPSDIVMGITSTNAVVRRGQKQWTEKNIYLRCNAACTTRIYLVV